MLNSYLNMTKPSLLDCAGIYQFPYGIPGFGDLVAWQLEKTEKPYFFTLTSLLEPMLSFVLLDPLLIFSDYDPALDPSDYSILQLQDATDPKCIILCIVTIPENIQEFGITINLRAPLLFNNQTKCAAQCLSLDDRWSIREKLGPIEAKAKTYVDTL
ncbi:MAG: flagellar assembly protein FliW [Spirochaetia bacterium]